MMQVDMDKVTHLIRQATEVEILPRFQKTEALNIREKKPNQLVTEADIQAERYLAARLPQLIDGHIVGEEGVETNPSLMDALDRKGVVWVIDPVDGTGNFAKGNPRFAVVVALVVDGQTLAGWIHDPMTNRTLRAAKGQGAWLDGVRQCVAPQVDLSAMSGSVKVQGRLTRQVAQVSRRGSAAHDYFDLATGAIHFAHFRKLMPWDHAAGVLIHAEAGGYGAMLDGDEYRPVLHSNGDLLLAPGKESWLQLAALID